MPRSHERGLRRGEHGRRDELNPIAPEMCERAEHVQTQCAVRVHALDERGRLLDGLPALAGRPVRNGRVIIDHYAAHGGGLGMQGRPAHPGFGSIGRGGHALAALAAPRLGVLPAAAGIFFWGDRDFGAFLLAGGGGVLLLIIRVCTRERRKTIGNSF